MMRFLFLILILISQLVLAANHRGGLHLQLPGKTIDFDSKNIEHAEMWMTSPDHAAVMIRLRDVDARKLYTLTTKAIGESALWIWNGRVLSMDQINAPFESVITVYNFTEQEVKEFIKGIN